MGIRLAEKPIPQQKARDSLLHGEADSLTAQSRIHNTISNKVYKHPNKDAAGLECVEGERTGRVNERQASTHQIW